MKNFNISELSIIKQSVIEWAKTDTTSSSIEVINSILEKVNSNIEEIE